MRSVQATLRMPDLLNQRAALVMAHPGHELRVHHWLELAKPQTFVLTDGSGRSSASRLQSTTHILQRVQARPGVIYGRFSDRQLYTALLDHKTAIFVALVEELAAALVEHAIEYVIGDALEGYNPGHDVCRLLVDAAVARANQLGDRAIANFCFFLINEPAAHCKPLATGEPLETLAIALQLDEAALTRKLAAAKAYAELRQEVDAAIETGMEAFQIERLHPVVSHERTLQPGTEPPFYERYGERQVALGLYQHVIRYREHLYPLAQVLHRFSIA